MGVLCFHHYTMKQQVDTYVDQDLSVVTEAAEKSMNASYLVVAIDSFEQSVMSWQLIKSLHDRYGAKVTMELTGVNTIELLKELHSQKTKIKKELINKHNITQLQNHPLYDIAYEE
jgi:hypothetical protein